MNGANGCSRCSTKHSGFVVSLSARAPAANYLAWTSCADSWSTASALFAEGQQLFRAGCNEVRGAARLGVLRPRLQNSAALAEEARGLDVALKKPTPMLCVFCPLDLDPQLTADIWGNQGRVQVTAGLVQQSEQSNRVPIRLHANIEDCEGRVMVLARLGTLLVQVGSIAEGSDQAGSGGIAGMPRPARHREAELLAGAPTPVGDAHEAAGAGIARSSGQARPVQRPDGAARGTCISRTARPEGQRVPQSRTRLTPRHPARELRLANAAGNRLLDDTQGQHARQCLLSAD